VQNIKYLGNKEKHTSAGTGYSQAWTEGSRSKKKTYKGIRRRRRRPTTIHP
jgi:hypothetical protein